MEPPKTAVELLQKLIQIPSVNPEGTPGFDRTGEKECAEYVGEFLKLCGASVTYDEVLPDRPNVIGKFPCNSSAGFRFLFAPHTDTVSVLGMTVEPFGGEIRDGKVFGRGASDTKGTMAGMLWALYEMRGEIADLNAEISFVGLMGEEAGQPGSQHFAEKYSGQYDFALVGEPTELKTVYAHKGCSWIDLITRGVAAHGASPQLGDNAVRKMFPVLDTLLAEIEAKLPDFKDPHLGDPTLNLGKISGGHSTNIVPDICRASLDIRSTPPLQEAGGAEKWVRDMLKAHCFDEYVDVEVMVDAVPLLTSPDHPGVQALMSIGSELTTAPWFCDAGRLAGGNIPAVACGPGNIAQAHTKDEFLDLKKFEDGVEFYGNFLKTFR